MNFFARTFDGRVDDAKAGWKGRSTWTAKHMRGTEMTEGGDKNTPSELAPIQIRPGPLAK